MNAINCLPEAVLQKPSLVFTWDDDFERHYSVIGPLFEHYGIRCTFFVNPGEKVFKSELAEKYFHLKQNGFEIGSHGYTHHHYLNLTNDDFIEQLSLSKQTIGELIGEEPVSFAFPHHEFTQDMLKEAKGFYLETRNTLNYSVRFGLKSSTTLDDARTALELALLNRHSLIFSGHSVMFPEDTVKDGYEPIKIKELRRIIELCITLTDKFDICTFEKASIKEYIMSHGILSEAQYYITSDMLEFLKSYGISMERLTAIIHT